MVGRWEFFKACEPTKLAGRPPRAGVAPNLSEDVK